MRRNSTIKKDTLFLGIFLIIIFTSVSNASPKINLKGSVGSSFYDVIAEGSYAYVASNDGITIFDVSDTSLPLPVSSYRIGKKIVKLTLDGKKLYLSAGGKGIFIINVEDPLKPSLQSSIDTPGYASDISIVGDKGYVADGKKGLTIINLKDISNPKRISTTKLIGQYLTKYPALNIDVSGNTAYIACGIGFVTVDIGDAEHPAFLGEYRFSTNDIVVSGDTAYICGDTSFGLATVDITTPSKPSLIARIHTPSLTKRLFISGDDKAYLSGGSEGFFIADISGKTNPSLLSINDTGDANSIFVSGTTAFIADSDDGLLIYDVSKVIPLTKAGFYPYDKAYGVTSVYCQNDMLYVTDIFSGLSILDISNPSVPLGDYGKNYATDIFLAGSYEGISGTDVVVSDTVAYLTGGDKGLIMLDVSIPSSPEFIGAYDTPGYAYEVKVSGTTAYVLDRDTALLMIDISNSSSPTLLGKYDIEYADTFDVSNGIAYIAGYQLIIVDVKNPSDPQLIYKEKVYGPGYTSICVSGNAAYMAKNWDGIKIFDVSDPSAPLPVWSAKYNGGEEGNVFVNGSTLFFTTRSGLLVFDITNSFTPVLLGSYSLPVAENVYASGNMVYVSDHYKGINVLNAEGLSTPSYMSSYNASAARDMGFSGKTLLSASGFDGMTIIDVSNPVLPVIKKSLKTSGFANSISISGTTAFIANLYDGLVAVSISDTLNPAILGRYDSHYANDVEVAGDTAYLADGEDGLKIINVSNPSVPELLGAYDTAGWATNVTIDGNYAYVSDGQNGLVILDISTPSAPALTATFDTQGDLKSVFITDTIAILADGSEGISIVDVSNHLQPMLKSSLKTRGYAYDVDVSGNVAYIADGNGGISVIEISDIENPKIVCRFNTNGWAHKIILSGDLIYLADGNSGVKVFDMSNVNPVLKSIRPHRGTIGGKIILRGRNFGIGEGEVIIADKEVEQKCIIKKWKNKKIKALIPESIGKGLKTLFVKDAMGVRSDKVKPLRIRD